MKIDRNSKVADELWAYCKSVIKKSPKVFFESLLEKGFLENVEFVPLSTYIPEKTREIYKTRNSGILYKKDESGKELEDPPFSKEFLSDIYLYFKKYSESLNSNEETKTIYSQQFSNAEVSIEDELIPNKNFGAEDFFYNLFLDKEMKYEFIKNCNSLNKTSTQSTITNAIIEVKELSEEILYPTKYKVVCTHKVVRPNGSVHECGNVVYFSEREKHSKLTCIHSLPSQFQTEEALKNSHAIKNLDSAPVYEMKKLYSAFVNIYDEKKNLLYEDCLVYSLEPLLYFWYEANIIITRKTTIEFAILLGKKELNNSKELTENICLKKKENFSFLTDLFDSLKHYYKNTFSISLYNQNRLIGELYLFITLSNIFFDKAFHALIIGQSSSGKTVFEKFILRLLTLHYVTVMGTNVTRNALIGGQSAMKALSKNTLFKAGYIATKNVVVAEESTNALDEFHNPIRDQSNNLFSLLKLIDQEIDVGIQGSKPVEPKASMICIGNITQLSTVKEYKKKVNREYFKRTGQSLKLSWPLFAPIEWYKKEIEEKELAEVHTIVRKEYLDSGKHYVTHLPEAEMARFSFFILMEEKKPKKQTLEKPNDLDKKIFSNLHTLEFFNELKETFDENKNKEYYNKKKKEECNKKIHEFLSVYILEKRNNIKIYPEQRVNLHVYNHLFSMCTTFFYMQKLYFDKPYEFEEEDKILLEDFLLFNYNSLDSEETCKKVRPLINDLCSVDIEKAEKTTLQLNKEYVEKKKRESDSQAVIIKSEKEIENGGKNERTTTESDDSVFGTPYKKLDEE